ncbi:hypothetical protein [Aquimarina sp. 2201CG5-10]|uniref:hypothetical protein n=1 Tax=Aquimarina callyspongiae TaxID=3098150 RepID=UPI002AB408EA|nr:hypothetical protein [Aquimarina sp. 2201CG5-10]MDY8134813.1 hypothetical protein [Aquimarina sp. 2201CG5-10]
MKKRYWYTYLIIFTLCSCDHFVLKKENREDIVEKRWNELDKNDVDQPPLFKACQYKVPEELEQCFQNTITKHIHSYLMDHPIKVTESINDTIWVSLLITKEGIVKLEDFNSPDILGSQAPDFKNIIAESINTLPEIKPAHTRSTPTSARYKLPLVIQID